MNYNNSDNTKIVKEITTTSTIVSLRNDGIVETKVREDFTGPGNIEIAREIMKAVEEVSGNSKRPILSWLTDTPISKEERDYYSTQTKGSAAALVVRSNIQRIIGNFFTGFSRVPIPIKLFTSEEKAIQWLKNFIE